MGSVLFATVGSWGDLFPSIGVAREVQERGHSVRVGASPAWYEQVAEARIEFVPLGRSIGFSEFEQHPEILRRVPFGLRAALNRFLFDQADSITSDLEAVMAGTDLLVAHPAHVIAQSTAEKHGIPYAVATVFPSMIPSRYTVPAGTPWGPLGGSAGRAMNGMAWRTAEAVTAALFDRPINRHRVSLGLGPVRAGLLQLPQRARRVLVMASPHVAPPAPDWPPTVRTTSFVGWDRSEYAPLQPRLAEFIDAGTPPMLVTLGGSGGIAAGNFLEFATDVVVAAGARALVVSGAGPVPTARHDPDVVHITDYVPFRTVAARCRLGIHHAGIGTSVALMRAGIPHVAVPRAFDQPVTASLIQRLGVGTALPWRRRRHLAQAIDKVLGDQRHAAAAHKLAAALASEPDGATLTANAVDELLAEIDQQRP